LAGQKFGEFICFVLSIGEKSLAKKVEIWMVLVW